MSGSAARRLVLLRHGRTSWNHVQRAQGHAPVELDEVGHQQARRVAELLSGLTPSRLWSSDLTRAHQTAGYLSEACGLPVELDPRLREFDAGEREGLTHDEAAARWPQLHRGMGFLEQLLLIPGAESVESVWERIVPAVTEALDSLGPGEVGIVVTHGASMKLGLSGLLGWPRESITSLGVFDNCQWCSVRQQAGDPPKLQSYGRGDFASTEAIG